MDKFAGNFRLLDRCDASAIKQKVLALAEADWEAVNWRQERFEAHQNTQTIELIFDRDFRHENPTKRDMYFALDCDHLLAPLVEPIAEYYTGEGYLVRALLVRLRAKGMIVAHVDTGFSLLAARRIHFPVITNEQVVFTVRDEPRRLPEGELWEINNARSHSVENRSEEHRVHLIMDWVVQ